MFSIISSSAGVSKAGRACDSGAWDFGHNGSTALAFCPRCASELSSRHDGGRERVACPSCSYVFFGDFSIGVGGVVIRDGRALLIRRGQEPRRGWWQIPGGYVEHDEQFDAAVVRERSEERRVGK